MTELLQIGKDGGHAVQDKMVDGGIVGTSKLLGRRIEFPSQVPSQVPSHVGNGVDSSELSDGRSSYFSNKNVKEENPPDFRSQCLTSSMRIIRTHSSLSEDEDCEKSNRAERTETKPSMQRKTHRKQHIHPNNNKNPDWMTQLAYSFRSPSPTLHKKSLSQSSTMSSAVNVEYPHFIHNPVLGLDNNFSRAKGDSSFTETSSRPDYPEQDENTSLLGSKFQNSDRSNHTKFQTSKSTQNFVALAASFLRDYEAGRPPTLDRNFELVTDRQIRFYEYKFGGYAFQVCMFLASMAFFASSTLEGFHLPTYYVHHLTSLNFIGLAVFILDIWFRYQLQSNDTPTKHSSSSILSQPLVRPLILFSILLAIENIARITVTPNESLVLFSSLFKPIVLFYASSKARDAFEALRRILRIVLRVLAMELFLILMFAAVACRLFPEFSPFTDLGTSWFHLFELSTTVVNPSIWLPIYQHQPVAALFFIVFIVTSVFYTHSLVLSVVFSTYMLAAAEIHERSNGDREDSIQMAFAALQQQNKGINVVSIDLVRETLRKVRPHYNAMKINALVEIVDSSDQRVVDFSTFRTKIRLALNASIRTARSANALATFVELVAVVIAVVNFIYVIIVSSRFHAPWFDMLQKEIGAVITFFACFELLIRFNPLRIPDFTPLTRLNAAFDGLAMVAAAISIAGIIFYTAGYDGAIEYLLIGRAIDIFRIMRFFQIFRDVVRRSSDVIPALTGPVVLVITTLHIFVYLGMALWGGAVKVGQHFGQIEDLYDLNNFNSYAEGFVTMFQVLVVNDWNSVAQVFLFADRCSSPFIVYPFFILGNLMGVSIVLNVSTAFFVETFVTKLDDGANGQTEATTTTTVQKDRDFNIMTAEKRPVRRVASAGVISHRTEDNQDSIGGADADSEGSSEDLYEFDIYEREGFDRIMETVAGISQNHDFAQQMCKYLEIFENLAPGREKVGYLVCDQRTLERFGNRRFQTKAVGFLTEQELNRVVSDMHAELLVLSSKATFTNDRALIRAFPHRVDQYKMMEISASILRRHPAVSLFVLRLLRSPGAESPQRE